MFVPALIPYGEVWLLGGNQCDFFIDSIHLFILMIGISVQLLWLFSIGSGSNFEQFLGFLKISSFYSFLTFVDYFIHFARALIFLIMVTFVQTFPVWLGVEPLKPHILARSEYLVAASFVPFVIGITITQVCNWSLSSDGAVIFGNLPQ